MKAHLSGISMTARNTTAGPASYLETAELLKSLAHPHRLLMVQMLLKDRYTVGELADACDIPSHMASEHLRLMQRSGLLLRRKQGRKAYYEVVEPRLAAMMRALNGTVSNRAMKNIEMS